MNTLNTTLMVMMTALLTVIASAVTYPLARAAWEEARTQAALEESIQERCARLGLKC